MFRNSLLIVLLLSAFAQAQSQTARVQILHNAPDTALEFVDVWLNDVLIIDDFEFRTATSFVDVPANDTIEIRISDSSSVDTSNYIAVFEFTLTAGESYIIAASGLVSSTAYMPFVPFDLHVFDMGQESAAISGNTDVLIYHGSTDAPSVDIEETETLNAQAANDLAYGQYTGYLNLQTDEYRFRVLDSSQPTAIGEYEAPLAALDLEDSALIVVASGFANPAANSMGAPFGLFAVLAEGGPFIPLTHSTAYLQVIHNAADSLLDTVDVFINGTLVLDNVEFRTASGFIETFSAINTRIAITELDAQNASNALFDTIINPDANTSYIAIANGFVDSGYPDFEPLELFISEGLQEAAFGTNTELRVFNGVTDIPAIDVRESGPFDVLLAQSLDYGDLSDYTDLPTATYQLEVFDPVDDSLLAVYDAPLASFNLFGQALTVVTSGFLNPLDSGSVSTFGLWVATTEGGQLIELSRTTGIGILDRQNAITVFPNPANDILHVQNLENADLLVLKNVKGQVVTTMRPASNTAHLDVSDLAEGFYLLSVLQGDRWSNHKVVIQ